MALNRKPGFNLDGSRRKPYTRKAQPPLAGGHAAPKKAPPRKRRAPARKKRPVDPAKPKPKLMGGALLNVQMTQHRAEAHAANPPQVVLPKLMPTNGFDVEQYRPEFCPAVIEFMSHGYTLSAFAAEIGVTRRCLAGWGRRHPEFVDAVQVAQLACQKWWEEQLHEVATKGTHTSGRVTAIVFALKNRGREDWADVQRHEISGPGGLALGHNPDQIDTALLSLEELVALEHLATKALPAPDPEGAG